jgi:PmbA protein
LTGDLSGQAQALLAAARAAGADVADTVLSIGASVSLQRRLGKVEETERAEARELSLRVFVGRQSASVSASAIDPGSFARLAEQAVAMARVVPTRMPKSQTRRRRWMPRCWMSMIRPNRPPRF